MASSLGLLYLGAAGVGLAVALFVAWRGWLSAAGVGMAAAALGAASLITLVTVYGRSRL
jgi:hypothetical protein